MSTIANLLTTASVGIVALAAIFYQPSVNHPKLGAGEASPKAYTSYCHNDDQPCIQREIDFITFNNRTPITDIELTETYNITDAELFDSTESYSTLREFPSGKVCEDPNETTIIQ